MQDKRDCRQRSHCVQFRSRRKKRLLRMGASFDLGLLHFDELLDGDVAVALTASRNRENGPTAAPLRTRTHSR
jgi:hypothetical protein